MKKLLLYKDLYETLDTLPIIDRRDKGMDIVQMNEQLMKVVNFYIENDIKIDGERLTLHSFKKIFSKDDRRSRIINKYMEVFFINYGNPESEEFIDLIFEIGYEEELRFEDGLNPILDDIADAIDILNSKNKAKFDRIFAKLNKLISDNGLDIEKINYKNVFKVKEQIMAKINTLTNKSSKNKIKNVINNDEKDNEKIKRLYGLLTGDYSDKCSISEMKEKLSSVIGIIVKFKIFYGAFANDGMKDILVADYYREYSDIAKYDEVLSKVKMINLIIKELQKDLVVNANELETGRKVLKEKYRQKEKEIIGIAGLIDVQNEEMCKLKEEYLRGFYDLLYTINAYFYQRGEEMEGFYDTDKLFGVFDFDKLPPTISSVNQMEAFVRNGMALPSGDKAKFEEICSLSWDLINGKMKSMALYRTDDVVDIFRKK